MTIGSLFGRCTEETKGCMEIEILWHPTGASLPFRLGAHFKINHGNTIHAVNKEPPYPRPLIQHLSAAPNAPLTKQVKPL